MNSAAVPSTGKRPEDSSPNKTGYIRTLDGWRAIAVCAVIFYHSTPVTFGPHWLGGVQHFGELGVQLFFAISGYLICTRLLQEQRERGQISLRGFYIRRLFRIQPAAIVYLLAIGLLAAFKVLHPTLPASLSALFMYRNYYRVLGLADSPDDVYTNHFWSLAVEEHFYLLLPALIYWGRKYLVSILSVLSAVFFVWAIVAHRIIVPRTPTLEHWRTDIALQDLLIPALLAVLLFNPSFRQALTRLSSQYLLLGLSIAALLVTRLLLPHRLFASVIAITFPLLLLSTVLKPDSALGRLLESRPFVFVGRISYSLYLWQQLFVEQEISPTRLGMLQHGPWNYVCVFFCAVVSYYLIEKPIMRLGHRLAPPATPGRPDLIEPSTQ